MGSKSGLGITNSQLDSGRRRIASSLKSASVDDLIQKTTREIATLLGAASVRLYLRDPLTGELYVRSVQNKRIRETRVAPDTSSVVGYAVLTLKKSFAWKRDPAGEKRYVVAVPILAGGEPAGAIELIHGTPDVVVEEERLKILYDLVLHIGRRLQELVEGPSQRTPYDFLLQSGALRKDALKKAREEAAAEGCSVEHLLLTKFGVDKAALGRSLSEHFNCPFSADPGARPTEPELLRRISPEFLRTHAVLPVGWKGDRAEVIVVNPHNLTLIDDLNRQLNTEKLALSVAVREDILAALDKCLGNGGTAVRPAPAAAEETPPPARGDAKAEESEWEAVSTEETGFDLGGGTIDSRTIRLVNEAIQAAVDRGASDIHFETLSNGGMAIRFRVDGVCHDYRVVKEACSRPVISRLKIMAQLNIAERRLPQDGKIRLKDKQGRRADLRVAIMPTVGAHEDAVLRLLPEYQVLKLEQVGMDPQILERFRKVIEQPHGIMLCVGPTGSGKTTTLHAALSHVKGPEVKVWTAEDPVEIVQEGVRQVQVQAPIGLTFDRALRAFLRLDPDIIMIGEIRDRETADAAIEASLTGHLVFSTLHTNSASETVTRLLEMGLDPFTFGNSLLGVLAQRLVRRICEKCAESYTPSNEELMQLREQYGDPVGFDALKIDRRRLTLARGKGCETCFNTGYKGRAGIHEFLVVNPSLRRLIQARSQADKIAEEGKSNGMVTLRQDGIRKVLMGKTDLKEVIANTASESL